MDWVELIDKKLEKWTESVNADLIKIEQNKYNPRKPNTAIKEYCEKGVHKMFRMNGTCRFQCEDCGFQQYKCDSNCRGLRKLLENRKQPER